MSEPGVVRCSTCGTANRVPPEKLKPGVEAVCGRCKRPLFAGQKPFSVTDATFTEDVEYSPLPVLLDMWAPWCGPCRMLAPALDQLATELAGRVRIAKMNVDENPRTSARFRVQGIPALILFQNGREVDRIIGVRPKSEILRRIEQVIP